MLNKRFRFKYCLYQKEIHWLDTVDFKSNLFFFLGKEYNTSWVIYILQVVFQIQSFFFLGKEYNAGWVIYILQVVRI